MDVFFLVPFSMGLLPFLSSIADVKTLASGGCLCSSLNVEQNVFFPILNDL